MVVMKVVVMVVVVVFMAVVTSVDGVEVAMAVMVGVIGGYRLAVVATGW